MRQKIGVVTGRMAVRQHTQGPCDFLDKFGRIKIVRMNAEADCRGRAEGQRRDP
jgi:hypothetical protein